MTIIRAEIDQDSGLIRFFPSTPYAISFDVGIESTPELIAKLNAAAERMPHRAETPQEYMESRKKREAARKSNIASVLREVLGDDVTDVNGDRVAVDEVFF